MQELERPPITVRDERARRAEGAILRSLEVASLAVMLAERLIGLPKGTRFFFHGASGQQHKYGVGGLSGCLGTGAGSCEEASGVV